MLGISLLALIGCTSAAASPEPSTKPSTKRTVGAPAYRFRNRFITNPERSGHSQIDLDDFFTATAKQKPGWLALNFTASWCEPCRVELSDFAANTDLLKTSGLLLIIVVVDDDKRGREKMVAFLNDELKLPFPVLTDDNHILSAAYGVGDLPLTLLIDPSGNYAWETAGATSSARLLAQIDQLTAADSR